MAHRVNFMLDDAVWQSLQRIGKGERSKVVNKALYEWMKRHRQRGAARRMDELREALPAATASEVAAWIREDRERAR
ncbi:MAG TPA: hypothetical protein VFX38_06465 [Gammaproteobacteria bacterium]|nr:hypothetical protein [Gammaproteobacteria bacterium]